MHDFLPFIVIGLTTGSIYGLAGTGLVLSYKTSGVFNFAFGAIAALSVFVFYWLHDEHGMAWPLAAVISVFVLGPVMGLLLELLARRLQRVDHVLQIAATVGLVLWIVSIGNLWYGNVSQSFPSFLPTSTVDIFGVNVEWEQIIIVVISLVGVVGLYLYLQYVRLGRAMRGVVDDPELVAMVGENPVGVRRWAWVISTTFAGAAGLLIAPNLSLSATTLTLLVVQAFGAAAIGYFSNLPLTYIGGLALGIADALATKYVNSVSWLVNLPTALPFIVLVIVLIITRKSRLTLRRFTVPISIIPNWQAPPRIRIGAGALVVTFLCFIPMLVGTKLSAFSSALTVVILFLSLGFLVRTSRQVSLCQYAFAAIGAVAMGHFSSGFGIPWFASLLLAGIIAIPIGALVAIPAIRLSGVFLALATYGFGVLLQQVFYPQSYMFGLGGSGVASTRPDVNVGPFHLGTDTGFYYVILACTVVIAVGVILLTEGRLGRMLRAMGDSPVALESYGLSINVTRVLVFCVSAFIAAISGALSGSLFHFAVGTSFPSFGSLTLIALVVVIVAGDPWYAVMAAGVLTIIPAYLTSTNILNYLNAIFGVAAVIVPAVRDKIQDFQATSQAALRQLVERFGGQPQRTAVRAVRPAWSSASLAGGGGSNGSEPGRPEGLVVKDLSVSFGGALAVDNVSLAAPLGTITGLIGPNGAGKSTTFNACSGLLKPSKGRVSFLGHDVSSVSAPARARLGLGRTFQRVQLFESLDVRTNIELARESAIAGANPYRQVHASHREVEEIEGAAESAVELVGIEPFLDKPVRDLSTGQRRYVELARVLAGPFDVILLDEPSSGLDQAETERLGEILVNVVNERGIGLLLVEHDMSLVRQVCSHIFVLDFGNLIFDGSAEEMVGSEIVKTAYLGTEGERLEVVPRRDDELI